MRNAAWVVGAMFFSGLFANRIFAGSRANDAPDSQTMFFLCS